MRARSLSSRCSVCLLPSSLPMSSCGGLTLAGASANGGFCLQPAASHPCTDEFHEIVLVVPLLAIATYAFTRSATGSSWLPSCRCSWYARTWASTWHRLGCISCFSEARPAPEPTRSSPRPIGALSGIGRRSHATCGLFLIVVGVAWLPLIAGVVIPLLGAGSYRHGNILSTLIGAALESERNFVLSPLQTAKPCCAASRAPPLPICCDRWRLSPPGTGGADPVGARSGPAPGLSDGLCEHAGALVCCSSPALLWISAAEILAACGLVSPCWASSLY